MSHTGRQSADRRNLLFAGQSRMRFVQLPGLGLHTFLQGSREFRQLLVSLQKFLVAFGQRFPVDIDDQLAAIRP